MPRTITVFGATGTQGLSVVQAVISDKTFVARAVTRDTSSQPAQDLKAQGMEVVSADIADVESLKAAIDGSEAVFIVTIPFTSVSEAVQGKNIIDASKSVGVKFIVFSTLPAASKLSGGEFKNIIHYDQKAAVGDYLKEVSIPHTKIQPQLFLENCWKYRQLKSNPDGSYTYALPRIGHDYKATYTWVSRDLGSAVLALIKNYDDPSKAHKFLGETLDIASGHATGGEIAAAISKALGKPVTYDSPPSAGVPILDEMLDFNMKYGDHFNYGIPDRRLTELGVQFGSIEEFAEANKTQLLSL